MSTEEEDPGTEPVKTHEMGSFTLGRVKGELNDFGKGFRMTGGDWGSLTQLFFDNLSTLLGALYAIQAMADFGVPTDDINQIIWGKLVPGVGITLCFGNVFYTWQAIRLTKKWGRPYTAQPYGLNTPAAFAFVYNIMYPVYFASSITESPSNAFALAYQVALSANFITGLILTFLGCFGPYLLQIIPPAALLVPIAGIGFAFLGMEQITACIAAPIVGYNTIMWVFLGWYANVRVGFGGVRCPEALQVIIVGVILGWATGVNEVSAVQDAAKLVKWWGPKWVADEMFADFSTIKDFLGIVIPIGISAAATTLMCLVSAREAGDPFPVRESMIADGIGTIIAAFFGSPFGTVIYIGHPAHKRSGALTGYSCVNGCVYLILSWFGVLALMQSIVNLATIGPIVLFVGLMINEEALTFMPARHYAAFIIGLFPSIYDWVVNVSNLSPIETDDGGNAHLGSLPGWYGVLGWKRGSLLVSFVWVAMLVMVIDRQWKKATIWALVAAFFALFGIIHVPVAGFDNFSSPTWEQCVSATECWDFGQQWQFFVAYCMLAGTFAILQGIRMFLPGIKLDPEIHDDSTEAFANWFEEAATVRGVLDIPHHTTESKALEDPDPTLPTKELTEEPIDHDDAEVQA